MNKIVVGGVIGTLAIVLVVGLLFFEFDGASDTESVVTDPTPVTRPSVQARPNTFSIMTPEEKAASEEAARVAAEQAALVTATTSTSTETDVTEENVELEATN